MQSAEDQLLLAAHQTLLEAKRAQENGESALVVDVFAAKYEALEERIRELKKRAPARGVDEAQL